jgi:hypothetical protein
MVPPDASVGCAQHCLAVDQEERPGGQETGLSDAESGRWEGGGDFVPRQNVILLQWKDRSELVGRTPTCEARLPHSPA